MRLEAPGLGRGGPSQREDGCPALPCSFETPPGAEFDGVTCVLGPSGPFPRSPGSCPLQAAAVPECQCPVPLCPPSPGLPAVLFLKSCQDEGVDKGMCSAAVYRAAFLVLMHDL